MGGSGGDGGGDFGLYFCPASAAPVVPAALTARREDTTGPAAVLGSWPGCTLILEGGGARALYLTSWWGSDSAGALGS
jgi:hypothetical protein